MIEKIIAACGNDCAACPRYVGHPYEKIYEELRHTAQDVLRSTVPEQAEAILKRTEDAFQEYISNL